MDQIKFEEASQRLMEIRDYCKENTELNFSEMYDGISDKYFELIAFTKEHQIPMEIYLTDIVYEFCAEEESYEEESSSYYEEEESSYYEE